MDHSEKGKEAHKEQEDVHPKDDHDKTSSSPQSKGKGNAVADNIWSSSKMVAGALASGRPDPTSLSGSSSKSTGLQYSSPSGPSNAAQEAASGLNQRSQGNPNTSTAQASFKARPEAGSSASLAFDDFLGGQGDSLPNVQHPQPGSLGQSSQHVEGYDGSAVVDLLNQPWDDEEPPEEEQMLNPADAQKLRDALFGDAHGPALPWDHLLNFTPDFISGSQENLASSRDHLGTSDPQTTRSTWLSQWHDVLSAYTDEVWGDLGPLAAQARQEVETLVSPEGDGAAQEASQGALGRLRMILAHVRGSA